MSDKINEQLKELLSIYKDSLLEELDGEIARAKDKLGYDSDYGFCYLMGLKRSREYIERRFNEDHNL